jgi:hypothetical protein
VGAFSGSGVRGERSGWLGALLGWMVGLLWVGVE